MRNVYIIPKGKHRSRRFPFFFFRQPRIHYQVRFDASARYQTILPGNQGDINKLVGFADGLAWGRRIDRINSLVYSSKGWLNSARIGWNWNPERLGVEIFAYCYVRGERIVHSMGFVDIGEKFEIMIQKNLDQYQFFLFPEAPADEDDSFRLVQISRATRRATITGMKHQPYFGGDEVAPHEITIFMKRL